MAQPGKKAEIDFLYSFCGSIEYKKRADSPYSGQFRIRDKQTFLSLELFWPRFGMRDFLVLREGGGRKNWKKRGKAAWQREKEWYILTPLRLTVRGLLEKSWKKLEIWFDKIEKCAKFHFCASLGWERSVEAGAEKSLKKIQKWIWQTGKAC